jgi:hypothetical protein
VINAHEAKSRRGLLGMLGVPLPILDDVTITKQGRTGSLAPLRARWAAFPILVGHPVCPLVIFDNKRKCFAVISKAVIVYMVDGEQWRPLHDNRGGNSKIEGNQPTTAFFESSSLFVGYKRSDRNKVAVYETLELSLSANCYKVSRIFKGLVATPRSQREW